MFCYFHTFSLQTLPGRVWLVAVSIDTLLSRVFLIVHPQWNLIMLLPYLCYWQSPLQCRSCILSNSKAFAMSTSTMSLLPLRSVASAHFWAVSHSVKIFDLLLHLTFIHLNALIPFTVQYSVTFKASFNSMIFHLRASLGYDLIFSILFLVFPGKTLALLNKLPIRLF